MNSRRFAKTYYAAAFIFGVIIALLITVPARSAESQHANGDLPELTGALQ